MASLKLMQQACSFALRASSILLVDRCSISFLISIRNLRLFDDAALKGTGASGDALAQFPIFLGSGWRALNDATFFVAVINAFALVIGVHQIGPRYDRGDDEEFGPEVEASAIKCVDGRNHGLARFDQQFVALKVEAGGGINVRPTVEEGVQLIVRRGLDGLVLCAVLYL